MGRRADPRKKFVTSTGRGFDPELQRFGFGSIKYGGRDGAPFDDGG